MALIKITTAPSETFLPRKRTDGGVILFLSAFGGSRSQQKLNRQRYSSGR
jgi:hypothetical protein